MEERETGSVKWFNGTKGFGFITRDSGRPDAFVHFTAIKATGTPSIEEGQRVRFSVVAGPKGPQALDVELIS